MLCPSETAMPADSWPRCCWAKSPKYVRRATSSPGAHTPNKPHSSLGLSAPTWRPVYRRVSSHSGRLRLSIEPIEAKEVVLDRQDRHLVESGVLRVPLEGRPSHDGAGRRRRVV